MDNLSPLSGPGGRRRPADAAAPNAMERDGTQGTGSHPMYGPPGFTGVAPGPGHGAAVAANVHQRNAARKAGRVSGRPSGVGRPMPPAA